MSPGRIRKNIVMVCSQFPPVYGGAGKQAQLLSNKLSEQGWQVTVVTLDQMGVGSEDFGLVRVRRIGGVSTGSSALRRAVSTLALGFGALVTILIRRPRAVHVHGAYWWTLPAVLGGKLLGAVCIVKITRDGEDDPKTVNQKTFGFVPVGWLYGMSLRLSDKIIFLSTATFDSSFGYLKQSQPKLIRNGVDLSALERTPSRRKRSREENDVPVNGRITTFVGYLVEHKGVLDLLSAWKNMTLLPDDELWLVGPYEGFYRELTSSVIDHVNEMRTMGYNIRLFGHVESIEMPSIYWASDVFVLPSYAEGMPNSLAEAVVAGCSIVATDIAGIRDIVDSESAHLVQPGNVLELQNALEDSLKVLRPAGRAVIEALSIDNTVTEYISIYEKRS